MTKSDESHNFLLVGFSTDQYKHFFSQNDDRKPSIVTSTWMLSILGFSVAMRTENFIWKEETNERR